jgi:RHH-type proline utilization regulon transcriptional repressor/proline dehydrogenase/delta 1-pyrroline-5-carboxylate dehydrogenase
MTFISPALRSETQDLAALRAPLSAAERLAALEIGRALVSGARARADERPYLDAFLQEFGLSNQEGIALMCLAEALLRIPDDETADRLIAEKLASGNWDSHAGRSDSLFVNASTWGLMLTGRLVELPDELRGNANGWLRSLTQRASEPLVRQALRRAMKIIGSEFVVGRDIEEALKRSSSDSSLALCSFDMLGEGARTDRDAQRYFDSYVDAIEQIGKSVSNRSPKTNDSLHERSSISIKLSALDPRYSAIHRERVIDRLIPRARDLARLAAAHDIGLTIDAEEQDRLEISLEIFAALVNDPDTRNWRGLGLAVQAYGRRAMAVIEHVTDLARSHRRPLTVRLVKGAYWDSEIKRAQERGLAEYPLYTRKCSTDVSYLACARALLEACDIIYPQFATHNAHTIAAVLGLARSRRDTSNAPVDFEFQRLHGMGTLLYDEARRQLSDLPRVRVYAPVGPHADLLAYLVRRLLENGANTSFVNRFMDERVPVEQVVSDPISEIDALTTVEHDRIPLPAGLYGASRRNSSGIDFGRRSSIDDLQRCLHDSPALPSPASRYVTPQAVESAFRAASAAFIDWRRRPVTARADILERAADLLEQSRDTFIALLAAEAGKTASDAVAEVRETIDFCRYYAKTARELQGSAVSLDGPTGERNELSHVPRGVWCCISPWNFPLAIFTGQVVAALVTGNTVIAKPAETTPEIALAMCDLLYRAGLPRDALHVLPMIGKEFGEVALRDRSLAGVVFTGSTRTAQWLNRTLASREGAILPLIAETGGINAMIVDSTALTEQVVDDVMSSAFGSAGQRCSALRVLCLQQDCADRILDMLEGAMETLVVGDPSELTTDVGPVITAAAARDLEQHIERMGQRGRLRKRTTIPATTGSVARDRFVAPALIEIDSVAELDREAFGPVLHVVRYRTEELPSLLEDLRANGYGLTLGIQTRLEGTQQALFEATLAGNVYVNRNMIGAVVGVQPFGGTGLSGTGPKAGGPHYLLRFTTERVLTVNTTATGGNAALLTLD